MDAPASINFFKGHPSYRLLPNKEIIEATTTLLSPDSRNYDNDTANRHPLTYGSDEGAYWVRDAISSFLNDEAFKLPADSRARSQPEFINLDAGASYGVLSILLQTTLAHTGYTKQAFIISPTYFLINNCFIDAGFAGKLTAIEEVGKDSIDLKTLENKLIEFEKQDKSDSLNTNCINNPNGSEKKKIYKYVIYLVPTYSNPSGYTYSQETRLKLIEIARKYDMLIISDDVYDLLNYDQHLTDDSNAIPTPPKRFVHLDRETHCESHDPYGNTISNATFSKLIAPGLRFGYHETVDSKLAYQLSEGGANRSGGTPSQLNSMIVGTMLQNKSAGKLLRTLISTYKERGQVLFDSVRKWLPSGTDCDIPHGGYFVWIVLPEHLDMQEIERRLNTKHQVILANGSNFEVVGDQKGWGKRHARLSISFLEKEQIEQGIKLLGNICKEYANEYQLPF